MDDLLRFQCPKAEQGSEIAKSEVKPSISKEFPLPPFYPMDYLLKFKGQGNGCAESFLF